MVQRALEGGALCLMQTSVWFQFPQTLQTATPEHEQDEPNEVISATSVQFWRKPWFLLFRQI